MAIKLADTLAPMADFPAAMAEHIEFEDGVSLQEKYDNGELGGEGGGASIELTYEEYKALEDAGEVKENVNYIIISNEEHPTLLDATDVSYDETDTVKTKIDGLINDETASEDTVYSGKKINSLTGITSPTSLGKRLSSVTIASNYSYNSYNYGAKLASFNTSSFKKITFRHSYAAIKGSSGNSNVLIAEPVQNSNYMYVSHLESSDIRDVEIDCTKLKPDTTYELRFSTGGSGQFVMHLITDIKGWSETDVSNLKTGIEEAKTYGIGSVSQLFACVSGDALFSEGYVSGAGSSELGTIDLTPYRKITYNNFTSGGGSIHIRDASNNIIRNTTNVSYGAGTRCEIDVTDLYGEYKVVIGTSATIIVTDVKGIKYTEDIPTNLTDAIFYLAKKIAESGG